MFNLEEELKRLPNKPGVYIMHDKNGKIIYVGKGCRNRYKVTKHNRFFNDMIKRNKCESRIIKKFENEKDAFDYEFIRINELKEKGECVCNIYNGGTGGSINWWTDEIRKKYSESVKIICYNTMVVKVILIDECLEIQYLCGFHHLI